MLALNHFKKNWSESKASAVEISWLLVPDISQDSESLSDTSSCLVNTAEHLWNTTEKNMWSSDIMTVIFSDLTKLLYNKRKHYANVL